jgi:hypothetical protein
MREKIENIAGLTFEARSAASLADTMMKAMEPAVFDKWHARLSEYDCAKSQHLAFLKSL